MTRRSINLDDTPKPTRTRRVVLQQSRFSITGKSVNHTSLRVTDSVTATDEQAAREAFEKKWPDYKIEEVKQYRALWKA